MADVHELGLYEVGDCLKESKSQPKPCFKGRWGLKGIATSISVHAPKLNHGVDVACWPPLTGTSWLVAQSMFTSLLVRQRRFRTTR